jgi:hypothetical protein
MSVGKEKAEQQYGQDSMAKTVKPAIRKTREECESQLSTSPNLLEVEQFEPATLRVSP